MYDEDYNFIGGVILAGKPEFGKLAEKLGTAFPDIKPLSIAITPIEEDPFVPSILATCRMCQKAEGKYEYDTATQTERFECKCGNVIERKRKFRSATNGFDKDEDNEH
jgi:hypothetical protein